MKTRLKLSQTKALQIDEFFLGMPEKSRMFKIFMDLTPQF